MSRIEELKRQCRKTITEEFGKVSIDDDDDLFLELEHGILYVICKQADDNDDESDLYIDLFSVLARDLNESSSIIRWVNDHNHSHRIGKVYSVDHGDERKTGIYFSYVSLVVNNQLDNLNEHIMYAAGTIDDAVPEINEKFR